MRVGPLWQLDERGQRYQVDKMVDKISFAGQV